MKHTQLESLIESVLFYKNEPVSLKYLSEILSVSLDEIEVALKALEENLHDRGVKLMRDGEEVILVTSKESSEIIEKITKDELSRDIGKAGLEVLSIVLYHGRSSRREIDYVRGVNSSFILRNLLIRGLIEKVDEKGEKSGERGFVYKPTLELLSYLGVTNVSKLPEFEVVKKEIEQFKHNDKQINTENERGQ